MKPLPTVGLGAVLPVETLTAIAPIRKSFGFKLEIVTDCVVPLPVAVAGTVELASNGLAVLAFRIPNAIIMNLVLLPCNDTVMVPEKVLDDIAYQVSTLTLDPYVTPALLYHVRAGLLDTADTVSVPSIETIT